MKRLTITLTVLAMWGCAGVDANGADTTSEGHGSDLVLVGADGIVPKAHGTKLYLGGNPLYSNGWFTGSSPDACQWDHSVTCAVPWFHDLCVYGLNQLGALGGSAPGYFAQDMGDIRPDFDIAWAASSSESSCQSGENRLKFVADSWGPDWSNWSETWMYRVVDINCDTYEGTLNESYPATWKWCSKITAKVNTYKLNQWLTNHGYQQDSAERRRAFGRVVGYAMGVAYGLGETDVAGVGYMYERLNTSTVEDVDLNGFEPLVLEDWDSYGSTLTLGTTVVY